MSKRNAAGQRGRGMTAAERPRRLQTIDRDFSTAVIAFHEAIAAQLGMSAAEWKSLGVLEHHGPLTAGRLAELSGFTTGAITGIADRLERAGYVRRERHPSDRRSVIIRPLRLHELKARVAPIFESLARRMADISAAYTPAQLAAIYEFFTRTTDVLRGETSKLKARASGKKAKRKREFPRRQKPASE